ncbi:Serine/threonine-protein phosphatase 2A activator [Conglomerata obtusa]
MVFKESKAFFELKNFITTINESVKIEEQQRNHNVTNLTLKILKISDQIELASKPQRFGNEAFASFYEKLSSEALTLLSKNNLKVDDPVYHKYLVESFGNPTRIDYGTGHELNFLCFLYVLYLSQLLQANECYTALDDYFTVIRKIIYKYNLEPAGSHGAWGVDDYQIIPFLLGAAELYDCDIPFDDLFLESNMNYGYAKSLSFVVKQKCKRRSVPFEDHSPVLYDLKTRSWMYVNVWMMNKFVDDVLRSRAVYQHFIYSKFLSSEPR